MSNHKIFDEMKKAQNIWMETIDRSARVNLDTVEKLMELNKQRFSGAAETSSPSDFVAQQSAAFKDYAEAMSAHFEALTAIGSDSRDQLTELSQEFAKGIDFSSFFPVGESAAKPRSKSSSKSS